MDLHALRAAVVAATLSLGCFLATVMLGFLGGIIGLATSVAPAHVAIRFGEWAGGLAVLLTTVFLGLVLTPAYSLVFLAMYGGAALVLPWLLVRRWRWDLAAAAALLATLVVGGMAFMAVGPGNEVSVGQLLEEWIGSEIRQVLEVNEDQFSAEQIAKIEQEGQRIIEIVRTIWPGMLAISVLTVLGMTLIGLCRTLKENMPWYGPAFTQWKSPEWLVWPLIGSGFLFVIPDFGGNDFGLNVLLVLGTVYFIHGLAVVTFFMGRANLSPFLRGLTYCMLVIIQPLMLITVGLGLFDLWFDFRKPRIKTN